MRFDAVDVTANLRFNFSYICTLLKRFMNLIRRATRFMLFNIFFALLITSCSDTKKISYFNNVKDSALVASPPAKESIIQKKDILSISVSSLSTDATQIFNAPNLSSLSASSGAAQTAGYLVSDAGTIKYTLLGDLQAQGLTTNQLENNIAGLLSEKKLLFDPIVTVRVLNFRVTVLGEVNSPGVVNAPNEQLSILEAIGQAGDLTIYGLRQNIMLVRQDGQNKLIKRLNLNSTDLLKSPYYFLKSNDVIYVEPSKAKVASTDQARQLLPLILSSLSIIVIILTRFIK